MHRQITKQNIIHPLEVRHLSWMPEQSQVFEDISFHLAKNELLGIIGPNGAGKSSLIRSVLRLVDADGDIMLNGVSINNFTRRQIARNIAVVPQMNPVSFNLTVFEVVHMGLLPYKSAFEKDTKQDHKKIDECLDIVGLKSKRKKVFNTLSGGEQQRALIARALMQDTSLLILDEPTNHLDVHYQHEMLFLLKNLPKSVLVTLHDLNLAATYCDRLLMMSEGKLVTQGPPHEVLQEKILESVFSLPCKVMRQPNSQQVSVSFSLNIKNK